MIYSSISNRLGRNYRNTVINIIMRMQLGPEWPSLKLSNAVVA